MLCSQKWMVSFVLRNRAFGFGERPAAGVALVALTTYFGFAILDDVLLPLPLALPVIWTGLIWAKVTQLSKLDHGSLQAIPTLEGGPGY
jgi:hypothetical protein